MTTLVTMLSRPGNTIIGASATIGIVWLATTYGTNARSSSREWTKAAARPMPSSPPDREPDERLAPGVQRLVDRR